MTDGAKGGLLGELVDLGLQGAAVLLTKSLPPATPVKVQIDTSAYDEAAGVSSLPELLGHVVDVRRTEDPNDDRLHYRAGLKFLRLPEAVRRKLERILTAASGHPIVPSVDASRIADLMRSPRGREALYQAACHALDEGDAFLAYDIARELVAHDRCDEHRVLLHHAAARRALAHDDPNLAAREVERGLDLAPTDAELVELRSRIARLRASQPVKSRVRSWLGGQ